MRPAPVLLAAFLLPVAAAAPLVADAPPAWTVGDAWEYEGDARASGGSAQMRRHVEVVEAGAEEIRLRVLTTSNSSTGARGTIDQVHWLRASDHALLRSLSHTRASNESAEAEAALVTTYEAPCPERVYPFEAGSGWNVTCAGADTTWIDGFPSAREMRRDQRAEVGPTTAVRTPAGTFDALPVTLNATRRGSDDGRGLYAPSVCNDVVVESLRRGTHTELHLTGWRCASTGTSGGVLDMALPPEPDEPRKPTVEIPETPGPGAALVALAAAILALARPPRPPKGSKPGAGIGAR